MDADFVQNYLLAELVDRATDKRRLDIDADVLAQIKALCRSREENAAAAVDLLLDRLKATDAQARLHALALCELLLPRSRAFRAALAQHFPAFLERTIGFRATRPLPGPPDVAAQLRERALEATERWADDHGTIYQQIRLGMRYLRDVLKLRFPELRARAATAAAAAAEREARARELVQQKYERIAAEFDASSADMASTLTEIDEAFCVLEGRDMPPAAAGGAELEGEEWEDVAAGARARARRAAEAGPGRRARAWPKPQRMKHRHLPAVKDWLRVLVKVDVGEPGSAAHARRERLLRACIALRDRLDAASVRVEAARPALDAAADADPAQSATTRKTALPHTVKQKLLQSAPVVPDGSHLHFWDSDAAALVNQRGMEINNHWGAVDAHVTLGAQRLAEIYGQRASFYTPPALGSAAAPPVAAPAPKTAAPQPLPPPASQAAADRAHNAAVLAGAAGDEAYARRVAEEEVAQAKGGRGRKRKGTVVERLARKLLSGRARDAATGEMLETEMATHRDMYSNRAATWDSQGKHKPEDARSRAALLYLVFFVGLCGGFVAAQQLYLWSESARLQGAALVADDSGSGLFQLLARVAPPSGGRPPEVMIAISNYNLIAGGQLIAWLETVAQAGVRNYVVVAIDAALRDHLTQRGINVYFKDVQVDRAQAGTGDNHAISALKFKIIREFLELGWNVLLSDVDIVVVQNPFQHLYRDHDLEGMSDGFDAPSAFGHIEGLDDPSMGWARYAQGTTHLNLNSGLFYIQASPRTVAFMARIAARLAREKAWDQSVYNEELFFLSHDDYVSPGLSVRVMNIHKFMNSKVLFKQFRHLPPASQVRPVMVHINYHPDKYERMVAAKRYFIDGDTSALKAFPGGSEPGS
ncbi:hypothetical protein WJX81_001335 [Elliptochloris bilobata]|uniref:Nucleotide-diphospho-sugar transferase domain-containing protein n=1 Tax=Elliptochloris bilobata TaxID=381761 RepID=A0AAW1RUR9_9CHLO